MSRASGDNREMTAALQTTPAAAVPLLSVSDLAVSFGQVQALNGVSLTVGEGEIVALAGENGAGKTTLVRCIAGDITPGRGQIAVAGKPVPPDPAAMIRHGIGVVWQDLALCDNLDIASNLLLGRERRRLFLSETRMHAHAAALLAGLGIPLQDTTRSVRSLSGGQRQMVAVARAVAHQPRLLMLDEPTASLGVRMAAQVEDLIVGLRQQGTTILLACHDIDQMFRLADRILVLRHGRVVGDVAVGEVHPDEVLALLSGQEVDSSPRRQLSRLHGLADRLVSADPSSTLSLILSALGAALGSERLCIHLPAEAGLECAASLGMSAGLQAALALLPYGAAGGPVGVAAASRAPVLEENARAGGTWSPFGDLARAASVASSWSVPVLGPGGLMGVITVLRASQGTPKQDELELVTLYAGYAASAIERDRLLDQVTARNRVLETIREMLETLAGPAPAADGLAIALQSLLRGLQADEVTLVTRPADGLLRCRAAAAAGQRSPGRASAALLAVADGALGAGRSHGAAVHHDGAAGQKFVTVTFAAPGAPSVLAASWALGPPPADATALLEDAAHSLRLALEREEAWFAHQEATTLRRSQELQRGFLSRLSHELRTPLTAIRGYASSLLQPDVTWDGESQQRFLARIAAESARLGRLVDDLLDFSAIESGILRLQQDWCDISLVIDAAVACLPPEAAALVDITGDPRLPVVWADHDRLEQVFVNLLTNAFSHNAPGTRARVGTLADGPEHVIVRVADDGSGLPPELAAAPFEPARRRRSATAGAGLGLSIAKGIVDAHGGQIELERQAEGTCFRIRLPVEAIARLASELTAPPVPGAGRGTLASATGPGMTAAPPVAAGTGASPSA
jgi:signal transduction histidine kinase/ABC-type multidrug transport system ATPase subunit